MIQLFSFFFLFLFSFYFSLLALCFHLSEHQSQVLHFIMNPERMAQDERKEALKSLKMENEELLKQIQVLSQQRRDPAASKIPSEPLISGSSYSMQQKYQVLEKKLQETELKMQRLRQVRHLRFINFPLLFSPLLSSLFFSFSLFLFFPFSLSLFPFHCLIMTHTQHRYLE